MHTDLKKYCERLNHLAKRKPTDKYWNEVLEATRSKWEGIQVTAARTLSEWGDKESLEIVKYMLIEKATTQDRYSATNTIAEMLYTRINENDIEWLLDLYLKKSCPLDRSSLLGLISFLPKKLTRKRLEYYLNNSTDVNIKDVRIAIHVVEINK